MIFLIRGESGAIEWDQNSAKVPLQLFLDHSSSLSTTLQGTVGWSRCEPGLGPTLWTGGTQWSGEDDVAKDAGHPEPAGSSPYFSAACGAGGCWR